MIQGIGTQIKVLLMEPIEKMAKNKGNVVDTFFIFC